MPIAPKPLIQRPNTNARVFTTSLSRSLMIERTRLKRGNARNRQSILAAFGFDPRLLFRRAQYNDSSRISHHDYSISCFSVVAICFFPFGISHANTAAVMSSTGTSP